jgi:hypothetical protein
MHFRHVAAMIAACTAAAQPCLAADLPGESGTIGGRIGAFAGVRLATPLGGGERPRLRARLQIAPSFAMRNAQSGAFAGTRAPAGLELGLARGGAPALAIGGRPAPALGRQLGLHGSTPYIVVGGVLLLVGVLAVVASAAPTAGPPEGAF